MADSESAALTGLGDTPALGAVGETRTLMTLATATSRLRVYQFRHDRISDFNSQLDLRLAESSELYIGFRTLQAFSEKNFRSRFSSVLAGVVGFEPTNGGFRIRCLNRTWRYPSNLVRSERLELSWLSPQPPQGCASTNFATTACTRKKRLSSPSHSFTAGKKYRNRLQGREY